MSTTGYENIPHSHSINDPGHLRGANYIGGGSADTVLRPSTPVERIAQTLNEARELSARVRVIVDNLVGTRPESEAANKDGRPIGGGIITDLADNAEYALNELRRANDELSRLSKVLGFGL